VYVYGITRAGAGPPETTGVLGGPVRLVETDAVAAVVTPVSNRRVRAKRRDLLAHSDVLQAAHARAVVLPLRFGTLFASEEELRSEFLEPCREELLSHLAAFDGSCELRVRAVYHDQESVLAEIVAGDPEIASLRAALRSAPSGDPRLVRLGELVAKRYEGRRAADGAQIVESLRSGALQVAVDDPDDELTVAKVSFLIRDRDRREFDARLDATALRFRHLVDLTCIGPLPPHSFVSLDDPGRR
jgi:gas vesicle protein GvpL/GvpF